MLPAARDNSLFDAGLGVFLLGLGSLYLAEQLGWIRADISWGLPLMAIVLGGVFVLSAIRSHLTRRSHAVTKS